MDNKIELLRAVWYVKDASPESTVTADDKEKILMEMFKRIYEFGSEPFLFDFLTYLNKLAESEDFEYHTIDYFKRVLREGPFGKKADEIIEGKPNLKDFSDLMTNLQDTYYNKANVYLFPGIVSDGCYPDEFKKLPEFMDKIRKSAITQTDAIFVNGVKSSTVHDNALPLKDHQPQFRYSGETNKGVIVLSVIANYLIKDNYFYHKQIAARPDILKIVEDFLKRKMGSAPAHLMENNRTRFHHLTKVVKPYNPFNKDLNKSKGPTPNTKSTEEDVLKIEIKEKIKKYDKDGNDTGETEEIKLDLMLDQLLDKEKVDEVITVEEDGKPMSPYKNVDILKA